MALALDSPAAARIAATVRGAAWLVEMQFTTAPLRFTSAPITVDALGYSWLGLGHLCEVGTLAESADASAARLTISLAATNQALLAAALGNVAAYRGRRARLYLQLFDEQFQPVGAPRQRWAGYMDKVQVPRKRSPAAGGGSQGRIEMVCSRAGMARARNNHGLRMTDAQQQQRWPGDTGLRYVQQLLEQPSTWLSRRFQELP